MNVSKTLSPSTKYLATQYTYLTPAFHYNRIEWINLLLSIGGYLFPSNVFLFSLSIPTKPPYIYKKILPPYPSGSHEMSTIKQRNHNYPKNSTIVVMMATPYKDAIEATR